MKNEDGFNAGYRSFGRLCLFLIPAALGIGASVWLGVWIGVHQYRHDISQEDRKAAYVGAVERPKSKIAVEIAAHDCVHVVRADIDGKILLLYAKNDCHKEIDYMEWHWEAMSPDGTVISSSYENWKCPKPSLPGSSAECSMNISDDDRIKTVRVWAKTSP